MGSTPLDSAFFKDLFGTDEMRAIFEERNQLQRWLDVEAALARVEGRLGVVPQEAADAIVAHCNADEMSIEAIKRDMDVTRHPIVPVIKELERHCPGDSGEYIHWGATTQDIMDTGMVLQLKEAIPILMRDLGRVQQALINLAKEHRGTLMAGRTHGQQALPITFGYKVAVWADEMSRHIQRMKECEPRLLVGQFSGGAGTLSSLGERASEVRDALMEELSLGNPVITWHSARDNLVEFVVVLSMIAGSLAKMTHEVVLMQRTEMGELEEKFGPGQVGSSTMPQKRNPTWSEQVIAVARTIRGLAGVALEGLEHEDERDSAVWHSEWHFISEGCILTAGVLNLSSVIFENLQVKPEQMRRNLDHSRGLIMSEAVMIGLAGSLGRFTAHDVVYEAAQKAFEEGRWLKELLMEDERVTNVLSEAEIDRLLDPDSYLGLAKEFVDRVVGESDSR